MDTQVDGWVDRWMDEAELRFELKSAVANLCS